MYFFHMSSGAHGLTLRYRSAIETSVHEELFIDVHQFGTYRHKSNNVIMIPIHFCENFRCLLDRHHKQNEYFTRAARVPKSPIDS